MKLWWVRIYGLIALGFAILAAIVGSSQDPTRIRLLNMGLAFAGLGIILATFERR